MSSDEWKQLLQSSKKLERDRGAELILKNYRDSNELDARNIEQFIIDLLAQSQISWEAKQGALMGARAILEQNTRLPDSAFTEFDAAVKHHAIELLHHTEYAVRISAGEVVGAFCKKYGSAIYAEVQVVIFDGLRHNLEPPDMNADESQHIPATNVHPPTHNNQHNLSEIVDHARWKHLETWIKCLQSVIESSGEEFNSHIDRELIDLISLAMNSNNRFVRETCCSLLASIVATNCGADGKLSTAVEQSRVCQFVDDFSRLLSVGLADSCSQVRMAACIAARKFLVCLPGGATSHPCFVTMLPALCFNRYFTAEGVRLCSQETWNIATEGKGKQLVENHIDSVVEFYLVQLKINNPEVKDTACACIGELIQKMDRTCLVSHVLPILTALKFLFTDFSFSTRDASCVACGKLIASFPDETKAEMDSIYPLLFEMLQDNVPTVREAAAIALGNCVSAFGNESLKLLLPKIKDSLEAVGKTDSSVEAGARTARLPTAIPAITVHSVCDPQTGHVLGSVPVVRRLPEPWELADGCVCLICELSHLPSAANEVAKLLPHLANAASQTNYVHHVFFLQSVCKQLPVIFKALGKRILKMYLDIFLDVVFYCVSSDAPPLAEAGRECMELLSADIGPNIFRARAENHNPQFLQYLSSHQPARK